MPSLKIFKHGDIKQTLTLYEDNIYLAGRSDKCDIILEEVTGVSRQHFKISFNGTNWCVELLSKFGSISYFGAQVTNIELETGNSFSIHPYEFFYEEDQVEEKQNSYNTEENNSFNQQENSLVIQNSQPQNSFNNQLVDIDSNDFDEKTFSGNSSSIPYMRMFNSATEEESLFRLEGQVWTIGRDPDSDIPLDIKDASRKHFEVCKTNDGYFITDLSSNGTVLNGDQLTRKKASPLFSGDIITVQDLQLSFEIRDSDFENKINSLPPAVADSPYQQNNDLANISWQQQADLNASAQMDQYNPNMYEEFQGGDIPKKGFKLSKVSIATIVILLVGIWFGIPQQQKQIKKSDNRTPANIHESFGNLKKEQKTLIKDTYALAKNLYLKKKYELALAEFRRIHEIIPFYEKSRKLEDDCTQFINTQKTLEHIAEQKRVARELEKKVAKIISSCKEKMTPTITITQVNKCLDEALELQPEHPEILSMYNIIEERNSEKKRRLESQRNYSKRVNKGKFLFQKAINLEKTGKSLSAIKAYKTFISSPYPDPNKLKPKAQRSIASIQGSIKNQVNGALDEAKKYFEQSKFPETIKALRAGLKFDPNNQPIRKALSDYKKTISKQMRPFYEDAILEESIGNVQAAKDNWRKIKQLSYPGESYFKKSKIKLKKYGG